MDPEFTNMFERVRHALEQNNNIDIRAQHYDNHDPNTTVFMVAPQTGAIVTACGLNSFLESLVPGIAWTSKQDAYEARGSLVFGNLMFAEASHRGDCNARRWTRIQAYPDTAVLEKAYKGQYEHKISMRTLQQITWWKRRQAVPSGVVAQR